MIPLFKIGFVSFGLVDMIDIALVAVLIYQLYKLLKGTVAVTIFLGLLSIYLIYLVVRATGMELLGSILGQFIGLGFLAAIILFQQEIRRFLLVVGKAMATNNKRLSEILHFTKSDHGSNVLVDLQEVIDAVFELSTENTGALIVFTESSELREYTDTGDKIEAKVSKRLLQSIFNKYSPLHDGAVIISEGRVKAARCVMPVTQKEDLPAHFGLRHRAAIGITEAGDAIAVVVSEETGQVTIAYMGNIIACQTKTELSQKLQEFLHLDTQGGKDKGERRRLFIVD